RRPPCRASGSTPMRGETPTRDFHFASGGLAGVAIPLGHTVWGPCRAHVLAAGPGRLPATASNPARRAPCRQAPGQRSNLLRRAGPPRAGDSDLVTSGDHTGAVWRKRGSCGGGADRRALGSPAEVPALPV